MGFRFEQHDSMCGCERCAASYESENPWPVFDKIADPHYRDDGSHLSEEPNWDVADYDDHDDLEDDFEDD